MNIDFPLIMVLATILTGSIWAFDAVVLAPKRRQLAVSLADGGSGGRPLDAERELVGQEPVLVEYSRSLFPVILAVLMLRSFVVEPFRIPSGSMMPTLLVGDFILVNKYAYGIRLPVINSKVINVGAPKRGDVVVFRFPKNPNEDYIKRVIGLPGDKISFDNKELYVNGELVKAEGNEVYQGQCAGVTMSGTVKQHEDLLGVDHAILIDKHKPSVYFDNTVPPGHYFVMGDNRDNSNDSRYWGWVPEENLVGRAFMIWMNFDWDNNCQAWNRIGSSIK